MKNPFKKILDMKEKEPIPSEQETQDIAIESTESTENQSETMQKKSASDLDPHTELQKQLEESRNKFLYLFSDFENYKRNAARERMDLISTAGRDIMAALLPILDDFDRAAKNGALSEGTTLIHHKLAHTLKSKGLTSLDTKAGDDFDPDTQEAVAEIPAPSEESKGKIVDILEQGYTLGGKIIRHAKVVVGK
ncbi:MAG: nucleotide exchange factor GrpE [Saprospiraceae bacterium]|nr:nucleotide exchange factor GrpE [Saprospiraceae bacterium]